MTEQEYQEILKHETKNSAISAEDFPLGTLTCYYVDGTNVHIYVDRFYPTLKGESKKAIFIHKTQANKLVSCECEASFPAHKLIPSTRCFADRTRSDFAKKMIEAGYPLSFTSVDKLTGEDICGDSVFLGHTISKGDYYVASNRPIELQYCIEDLIESKLLTINLSLEICEENDVQSIDSLDEAKEIFAYHKTALGILESALYPLVSLDEKLSYWHHDNLKLSLVGNDIEGEIKKATDLSQKLVDELCSSLDDIHSGVISDKEEAIREIFKYAVTYIEKTKGQV